MLKPLFDAFYSAWVASGLNSTITGGLHYEEPSANTSEPYAVYYSYGSEEKDVFDASIADTGISINIVSTGTAEEALSLLDEVVSKLDGKTFTPTNREIVTMIRGLTIAPKNVSETDDQKLYQSTIDFSILHQFSERT